VSADLLPAGPFLSIEEAEWNLGTETTSKFKEDGRPYSEDRDEWLGRSIGISSSTTPPRGPRLSLRHAVASVLIVSPPAGIEKIS
jgi:hypothetical protein